MGLGEKKEIRVDEFVNTALKWVELHPMNGAFKFCMELMSIHLKKKKRATRAQTQKKILKREIIK